MISVARLREIWDRIRNQFDAQIVVASNGRGAIRREPRLSVERMQALLQGRDIEVTLERTIIAVLKDGDTHAWGNQFNVAGGVGGGNAYNRTAVDLVRLGGDLQNLVVLDLIELKEWNSPDEVPAVAEQIYTYFCMFWALALRQVEPYRGWAELLEQVRLWVMAPKSFFEPTPRRLPTTTGSELLKRLGESKGLPPLQSTLPPAQDTPGGRFAQLHDNLEALKQDRPELAKVAFQQNEIVLGSAFSRNQFLACFDRDRLEGLVRSWAPAGSPPEVVFEGQRDALARWVNEALARAGLISAE
jgi:hypothetical protein